MPLGLQGILDPYSFISGGEVETRIDAIAREIHLSDAPLMMQLPEDEAPAIEWVVNGEQIRPQKYTLGAAFITSDTTITINDTTTLQVGDVLEFFNTAGTATEQMLVVGIPSATTLTVERTYGGGSAVANTPGTATDVFLIGTASTGDEINKQAFRALPTSYNQRLQTFMYRISVGGLTEAMPNMKLPNGNNPRAQQARVKMTEFLKDLQSSAYYGKGQARSSTNNLLKTGRPAMLGLKEIIRTYSSGANVDETAKSNFTQNQITTLLIQKAIDGGGDPNLLLCSPDLVSGWQIWSNGKQQFQTQEASAILQVPITRLYISFGGKVLEIMYDYNLRKGTMAALTKEDIRAKRGRPMTAKPVGSQGDAIETDLIGDYSIQAGHPSWHAWVQGITSFA